MDSNRKTIKYIINEGGFKYHARKCVMMKGSTISKNIHPIYEVELLKKKLLETGKIIDKQTHFAISNRKICRILQIFIQVTADISNAETRAREVRPYMVLNDQIQKVLVVNRPISESRDQNGFTIIGITEFLLDFIK